MSDDTGYAFPLDDDQLEEFDPRSWGWVPALPYTETFPEHCGWGMPFLRDYFTHASGDRLIIEWEDPATVIRLYLNGEEMTPYTYQQFLRVVQDREDIHKATRTN